MNDRPDPRYAEDAQPQVTVELEDHAGSGPRSSRRTAVTSAALVALVFAFGIAVGYQLDHPRQPQPREAPDPLPSALAVTSTAARCAVQDGTSLQLGLEVVNRGSEPIVLHGAAIDLPIGGLRHTTTSWGPCGQVTAPPTEAERPLAPGATTWISATFEVLDDCPAPYPVRFVVLFTGPDATTTSSEVGGFSDLGDVPYTGCASAAAP